MSADDQTPSPADQNGSVETQDSILQAIRPQLVIGAIVIGVFIAFFVGWGATAPLSGGALARGVISPEGDRRTVQHLEGGIIEQLLVQNGDFVSAGDPMVSLQETQARASFAVTQTRRWLLLAQRARLRTEQGGGETIEFPAELTQLGQTDLDVQSIIDSQRDLFARRKTLSDNRAQVLDQRIAQLNAEIDGLREQITSQNRRLELIEDEIEATQTLLDRGLAPRPRLLALQREQASIQEQRAANRAAIARAEQEIGEAEVQLLGLDAERLDDITNELNEVQATLAEVNERLMVSEDVLSRTIVTAPISGTVVNLRFRTTGGVIGPGDPILDIVPDQEALIISARLSPLDVDLVSPGLPATVHLPALPQRQLSRISGEVMSISADTLIDEVTGETYYLLRVMVTREELSRLAEEIGQPLTLTAGMPAEVLVVTEERTLIDYLLAPLTESFRGALREA